jgi:hypothetical protein
MRINYPYQLINQGGDPYVFALYKRFGAAYIDARSQLSNTIGGKDNSTRYFKKHIRWNHGVEVPSSHIQRTPRVMVDVVVPTY